MRDWESCWTDVVYCASGKRCVTDPGRQSNRSKYAASVGQAG